MKLQASQDKLECFVCGSDTYMYKMSIMGQIKLGLCEEHKHMEPFLSFGPQFLENAIMGMYDATEDGGCCG